MENFILYEELGAGSSSVVYKGRRKGYLDYVAIICADKAKRPEITNHVRLSHDINHQNIVRFYEWYETSNHLWLVVELCTGGSLESVISQDGCLPEDVVKRFGWDLVQGLKHIHELGIIFSDLTPAKILLDGIGILKFCNFYLSKAEGETLESFFTFLSTPEEQRDEDGKEKFDNMRKRLQGSPIYSAPEVLQGSETSMCSDLWALGCILYCMYTGKPPFYSDNDTELKEMILHQEPLPPRQRVVSATPPSEDFQNLLNGLLNKNPNKRMDWPGLLDHPFWTQVLNDEEDLDEREEEDEEGDQEENVCCEGVAPASLKHTRMPDPFPSVQADEFPNCNSAIIQPNHRSGRGTESHQGVRQTTCGALHNNQGLDKEVGRERGGEVEGKTDDDKLTGPQQMCRTLHPNVSFTLDNLSEFRPKSGVDKDNTEAIFLLSSCANSRRSCSTSDTPNQNPVRQASTGTDITSCIKALLHTDSDLTVTPVMANPKILKCPPVRFDPKSLCVPAYSVEKLLSLNDEQWTVFVFQLCSSLEDQNPSSPSSSSTAPPTSSTVTRSRLNVLCYLCCVAVHEVIANKLINSTLLPVLTQQLKQAPNWDVRSKVLRVLGLLALHCTELEEDCPVSEAVSTLTDLLRDNLRNSKVKQFLLPPLGEFLYLIASQEEKRGSPEGLWFVPAAAYTGLMRSLREGDDSIVHHMAAKAIENITTVSGPSHPLVSTDIGSALWYLFTHSTVEAVRVTAISSLSRLARVVPGVFLAVIDTCSPAAILEGVDGAGARGQQHLLTAMATALVTSRIQTHRITQSRDLVLKVLRCLESPSTVTRAKALLLLLLLIQDNTQTLLYCCQHRLVMYLERDLRKATPLRENPSQSGYLSQCLDLLIVYLSTTAPLILEEVLHALRGVIGRRHPSTAQSRQLKHTLPTISVVLELLSSQVFRSHIVTEEFLVQIGLLLNYITSLESNETNLASAVGAVVCEEFIRTALSIVEVLSQHHALITPHHSTVVDVILPPLTTLAFSINVEWSVFVLRVLSELSLVLLVQNGGTDEDENTEEKEEKKDKRGTAEGRDEGGSLSPILGLFTKSLLPRYESLLLAAEPIPLYALKLLVSMTEHSMETCRLIKHSRILPAVFQLIVSNGSNVTSGMVQNAVALLCNLSGDKVLDLEPTHQQGLIDVVVNTLREAAVVHLDGEGHAGQKSGHLLLQALLELLHNILKQTSVVVRSALQSQRLSCPAVETEAAEKLLLANRPLSQLSTHLIQMLSSENQEVWEESLQCLSLLVQLYGGEGHDCLSPSCLQNFSHMLCTHIQTETRQMQRTTLRIIKRLVQTTDKADWVDCPEGEKLVSLLQDITMSSRCNVDVVSLAAEILHEISGS